MEPPGVVLPCPWHLDEQPLDLWAQPLGGALQGDGEPLSHQGHPPLSWGKT